jgi:hypothetical protein
MLHDPVPATAIVPASPGGRRRRVALANNDSTELRPSAGRTGVAGPADRARLG